MLQAGLKLTPPLSNFPPRSLLSLSFLSAHLSLSGGGGKVWGSDDINIEAWKPMKRLPGHESGESIISSYAALGPFCAPSHPPPEDGTRRQQA